MKKRITIKEYKEIGRTSIVEWAMPLCNFILEETPGGNYEVITEIKTLPYLILFIPAHLFELAKCIWDGGLITFELINKFVGRDHCSWGSESWKKAEKIMKNGIDK